MSFFGNGVSEPGTKPIDLYNSRPSTSETRRTKSREGRGIPPAQVDLTFPMPCQLPVVEVDSQPFRHLIKPLTVNDTRVKMAVKSFCSLLSEFVPRIFEDDTGRLNVVIQKFLNCLMCRRLFGLLCHYVFWNIIHPFVRRALVAAQGQHGHLLAHNHPTEPESLENTAVRRKSMMSFSLPSLQGAKATTATGVSLSEVAAARNSPSHAASVVRGSMIQDRVKKAVPAHRAATMCGRPTPITRQGTDPSPTDRVPSGVEAGNSLAELTLSSETSLTGEEKEMLYLQLEQCLNKLHTQVK